MRNAKSGVYRYLVSLNTSLFGLLLEGSGKPEERNFDLSVISLKINTQNIEELTIHNLLIIEEAFNGTIYNSTRA